MTSRMANRIANRMAKPMRSAWRTLWQNDAPNPNPNTQVLARAGLFVGGEGLHASHRYLRGCMTRSALFGGGF